MLSVSHRMSDSEYDADDGDDRSDLQHGPCRPVQGHERLPVAELQRHEPKHLHDGEDHGYGTAPGGYAETPPHPPPVLLRLGTVLLRAIVTSGGVSAQCPMKKSSLRVDDMYGAGERRR